MFGLVGAGKSEGKRTRVSRKKVLVNGVPKFSPEDSLEKSLGQPEKGAQTMGRGNVAIEKNDRGNW